MEAVQAAVEQACNDFKDPTRAAAAEQVLLQFRQSARPLPACRHLLEHSASLEARFHAACTLREALVREWAVLSAEEVQGLRSYLLHYLIIRCTSPAEPAAAASHAAAAVRSMLIAALAVLVKRSWLDAEGRPDVAVDTAFFQEMQALVAAAGNVSAQRVSMEILQAIVVEFSITSASPLGLPWDYHDKACRDLEERYLQGFFQHAVSLGRQAAASGAALRGEDGGSGAACLSLMAAVLGWDFQHSNNARTNIVQAQAVNKRGGEVLSVAPGQSWSVVLLAPETCDWLVDLLAALAPSHMQHGQGGHHGHMALPAHQQALAANARQLLVAFCSLSGEVLPRRVKPVTARAQASGPSQQEVQALRTGYLRQMLRALLLWTVPVQTALDHAHKTDEGQLLDACRCISALASNHSAQALEEASQGLLPGGGGILQLLEQLTLALVAAGGVSNCDDEPWLNDCTDMLLEAWSSLLQPEPLLYLSPQDNASAHRAQPAAPQAASVFRSVIEAALKDAAAGAHEDADDAAESAGAAAADDWLVRAAALARAAPGPNFSLLCQLVKASQARLFECSAQGGDPSEVLEQLVWLLRMTAHALADSGAGETPLMPLALLEEAEAGGEGAASLQALCEALLAVPALVLVDAARPALSPRLMETAVWALARWCDTYLLPEEPLPGGLQQLYGSPTGPAMQVLDGVVRVALVCLAHFPGETQLHAQVAGQLLPVLVRRRSLCRQLVQLASWQELAGAFATRQPGLITQLQQRLHRSLAQSLGLAAAGVMGPKASQAYVTQLMQPAAAELAALASRHDLDAAASQAHTVLHVCCLLEALRGCTRATLSATQPAVLAASLPLLQPLLRLQHAFRGHAVVVTLLLKLAAEMVENHISFLRPAESDALMRWVLELLQQYSRDNRWTKNLATSRSLQEDHQVEQCRDLQALVKLLSHVTQRDVAELDIQRQQQQQQQQQQLEAAQVVLLGLSIILPLISLELLKFPKLCHLYFTLLSYIMEVYTDQVAELAPPHFSTLMHSLEFGLQHSDPLVAQASLEGLAGIARHQHKAQQQGLRGLGAHQVPDGHGGSRSVTSHFLELLLRRLMLEDLSLDLVETAADALLPLVLCEPAEYSRLSAALASAQPAAGVGARIARALAALHPAGGAMGPAELNRQTKRAFRSSLCSAVSEVRGLIRMR